MTSIIEDIQYEPWEKKQCHHPEHHPPMSICIPAGKQLRHTCPHCGQIQVIRSPLEGIRW